MKWNVEQFCGKTQMARASRTFLVLVQTTSVQLPEVQKVAVTPPNLVAVIRLWLLTKRSLMDAVIIRSQKPGQQPQTLLRVTKNLSFLLLVPQIQAR